MHSIRTAEWGPGGFLQNYCVIRAKFVIICVLYCRVAFVGIQPERLNAEGFSPSALSRGWSVSATPGVPAIIVKASGRRENSCQGSRYSRFSNALWWGDRLPRVTLRFTLGYEPLALLGHSTFQVVCPVVLTRIFTELSGFPQIILGQRDKRVCARGYRLSSIILSEVERWTDWGLEIKKYRLDHRKNDSRAVSSSICQLLSDSNSF